MSTYCEPILTSFQNCMRHCDLREELTKGPVKMNESSAYNVSLEEYLELMRGPKHLESRVVLPITVVYALIFVTGVVGNVAVCAVIVRTREMHTATNYYLFSLAVSDLALLLLGLPNDLSVYWQQYPWALGETLCKFRAVVSEMMSYTSVLTIVAFSLERYLAICHPLYSYNMKGLRRALRIIAVLWIVSLASAAPFAAYTTVNYVDYPPGSGNIVLESAFCAMLDENVPSNYPVYELSSLLFFLLPMLVMGALYARMAHTICKPQGAPRRAEGSVNRQNKHNQNRKSIVRMLAAVVVAFFLCWAPFHLQRLLYVYARESPNFPEINEWMYYITGCFYYFSSTVNPILYNVMSAKYRKAFLKTLCCISPRKKGNFRDTFQESTISYANSVYKCSRYSACQVHNGEVSIPAAPVSRASRNWPRTSQIEDENHHCLDTPDVLVVTTNGKSKSFVSTTHKPSKNSSRVSRTDLDKCGRDGDAESVNCLEETRI